jgi:peptidyl-prolyl cis-trans isomerase D
MALAFLRRHRGSFKWLLVLVIATMSLSLVFLYMDVLPADQVSGGTVLAEVGGQPITVAEYQRRYQEQRARLQNAYGQGRPLDDDMLRRLGVREQTLQGLIDTRVLLLEARRLGLEVDDKAVAQFFAAEYSRNGRFMGAEEVRRILQSKRVTEREETDAIRTRLLLEKLVTLVTSPVMVSAAEVEQDFRRQNEQVKVEYVQVPAPVAEVAVTDDEVKAYFTAHADRYKFPERRVVSYVLLEAPALLSRVTVTDRELEAYHESHAEEFQQPEEACARHILVKVAPAPKEPGHPDDEARRLAQAALDQVKGGADFATVAGKVSEDEGSKSRGGDLSCFGRGRMVPEFDAAVFALAPGQVSDLVKTQFGYHVIRLDSKRESTTTPFAQAKERIRQTLTSQKVRTLLEEKAGAVAEALGRGTSLADVAREHGLTVQKSAPLRRGEGAPPLTSPVLVARAFEMKRGDVEAEPYQVGAGHAFIALDEIQAPRVPELKEVQDKAKADLQLDKALELARAKAADVKLRAEKEGLEKAAAAVTLVRKETTGLVSRGQSFGDLGAAASLDDAAFALAPGVLSEPVRLPRGYAVLRLLEKKAFDPEAFAKEKDSLTASLTEERRGKMFQAYLQEARKRFPVEKRPEVLRRAVAS